MVINVPSSLNNSNSKGGKVKSYIKAMAQLQAKAKQLEQDNQGLNRTVKVLRDENYRNAGHSSQYIQ